MSHRRRLVAQGILIAALAVATYARAAAGPFIWDDRFLIEQIEAQNLWEMLSGSFLVRPGGAGGDFYRPLTTLSLALDYALWGPEPVFFHITNLILHAGGALAIWALARRLVGGTAALIAALFFAVHPAHSEPVCWISGRSDLMHVPLAVLAIIAYLKWRGTRLVALAVIPAVLALAAKETAVVLAALAPLCLWLSGERAARKLAAPAALFGGTALVYFAGRVLLLPHQPSDVPPANTLQHAALVLHSLFMHLQILILPHSGKLGYQVITDEIMGRTLIESLVALAAVAYIAVTSRKDWPVFTFAVLWFAIAIAPASGIVRGLTQTVVAQRYVYLASAGLAILLGVLAVGKRARKSRLAIAGVVFIYFAATSVARSGLWSDDLVFWRQFVRDVPAIGWGYYHLGVSYLERDRPHPARESFLAAAELMPDEAMPRLGVGESFIAEGRPDRAIPHLEEAVSLAPGDEFLQHRLEAARSGTHTSFFVK